MTRRFFWLLLLLLLLWAGASYYGYAIFRISMIMLISLLLFSFFSIIYLRFKVHLEPMRYSREIFRLDTAKYSLELGLSSLLLPAQLRLIAWSSQSDETVLSESRLLHLTVRPKETRKLVASLESLHCGSLELGEVDLRVRDLFNIFWMRVPGVDRHLRFTTLVLPRTHYRENSAKIAKLLLDEGEQARIRSFDIADEIDTMREFQPGDTSRRIHWKVSARMQKFMIKQYEDSREIRYYVMLDPDYSSNGKNNNNNSIDYYNRDNMLEITASIISVLLEEKQWVELETWHPSRMLQSSNEAAHLNHFLRQLALLPQKSMRSMISQLERQNTDATMSYYILIARALSKDLARQISALVNNSLGIMLCLMEIPAPEDKLLAQLLDDLTNKGVQLIFAEKIIGKGNYNSEVQA